MKNTILDQDRTVNKEYVGENINNLIGFVTKGMEQKSPDDQLKVIAQATKIRYQLQQSLTDFLKTSPCHISAVSLALLSLDVQFARAIKEKRFRSKD